MILKVIFNIIQKHANLAHLVEQLTRNEQVLGSSPGVGFEEFKTSIAKTVDVFFILNLEPSNVVSADQREEEATGSRCKRTKASERSAQEVRDCRNRVQVRELAEKN